MQHLTTGWRVHVVGTTLCLLVGSLILARTISSARNDFGIISCGGCEQLACINARTFWEGFSKKEVANGLGLVGLLHGEATHEFEKHVER